MQRSRAAALDSRNKPHGPHAQDGSHPFDHGGRQVERRYRRERRCLVDLTTDLHGETNTVEKGGEIVAVLERRSIELTLGDPRDRLVETDPLGWQVPNLRLEGDIWNNPPAASELAQQAMNVPGETSCLRRCGPCSSVWSLGRTGFSSRSHFFEATTRYCSVGFPYC